MHNACEMVNVRCLTAGNDIRQSLAGREWSRFCVGFV